MLVPNSMKSVNVNLIHMVKGGVIFMQKVIDVSKWQGLIDYDKVAKSGKVEGVILRSSIGNSTDEKFFEYADGFPKAGIPVIGIYHFSHAYNIDMARKEAAIIISNCEKAGFNKKTLMFFDFEYESLDILKSQFPNFKIADIKKKIDDIVKTFCMMVESAGYKAGIYFNPDFYQNWFEKSTVDKYIKWLADWRGSKGMDCDIWQYGVITVDGISGNVDANECYITDSILPSPIKKTNEEIANDVIKGLYGVGEDRKKRLKEAGYDYATIQAIVNKKMGTKTEPTPKKSNDEIANAVIRGEYGVGEERRKKLTAEGYDYAIVQNLVNKKTNGTFKKVTPATSRDISISGTYTVITDLNLRYIPGVLTYENVIKVLKKGSKVNNYGYYTDKNGTRWMYVQAGNVVGHVDSKYITK